MSTESPVPVVTTRHLAGKGKRAGFLGSAIAPLEMTETQKQKDNLEQKLIKALKLAHCDFVFELEHGLDTEIGERGVRLS
jgi:ABC-type protease/lipase transport system fused ATPase/permease subunit